MGRSAHDPNKNGSKGKDETISVADISIFADIIAFIRTSVQMHPELGPIFKKAVAKHGRKFAVDRWLED